MFLNPKEKAAFFLKQYDKFQKTFSTFNELLTKDNSFGIKFKLVDNKAINSEIFGEPILISFTLSFNKEFPHDSFGKLNFFRIYPGKTQDDKEEFWYLYFDQYGNTYNELIKKA